MAASVPCSSSAPAPTARTGSRNRIKVHVNITNPDGLVLLEPARAAPSRDLPDVALRDHRKISFHDVTETDPARGEAIFTGMGVGDHYAGTHLGGPGDPGLKGPGAGGAQKGPPPGTCSSNRASPEEDEIPYPLRRRSRSPSDYAELVAQREAEGFDFRALQLHNETGYGAKPINVAKAVLYDTMPAGSIVLVPDSLWNSPFWAGMLLGNALRGGRVFLVTPALGNAPSAGFPQMSRAQEIFAEMIVIQQMMEGELRTWAAASTPGSTMWTSTSATSPGAPPSTTTTCRRAPSPRPGWASPRRKTRTAGAHWMQRNRRNKEAALGRLAALGFEPKYVVQDTEDRKPKLHLKAQGFLNRAGINVLTLIDWVPIIEQSLVDQALRLQGVQEYVDVRETWQTHQNLWESQAEAVRSQASAEDLEQAAGFLTVGSHNMDYRGMMMDGEVLYVTSGEGIMAGLRDLLVIGAVSTWVTDLDELEKRIPAYSEWQRRVGRFIKYAL